MPRCPEGVLVLDFGGQYAHLIRRRVRELGVPCELVPHDISKNKVRRSGASCLIFSGGPSSVYERGAPFPDPGVLAAGLPVLGICYGHQLIAKMCGGDVGMAEVKAYGGAQLQVRREGDLLKGVPSGSTVWTSHSDVVTQLPEGFVATAYSDRSKFEVIESNRRKLYGVQFHPEVSQTQYGSAILRNFVFGVSGCRVGWNYGDMAGGIVKQLKRKMGRGRAICAVSGGIDSTTAAVLVRRAIGRRLTCVFVDHGLLRKGEAEEVLNILRDRLGLAVEYVDASERFLSALRGIVDPETKRLIIGSEFAKVFEETGKRLGKYQWLVQGTLYPDVVESAAASSRSSRIKSHHNVGGLPKDIGLKVVEPLRDLYKDEVRMLAASIGIPKEIVERKPFPGPGLAVRIIGEVTRTKLHICSEASRIFESILDEAGALGDIWQAFAIVGDDKVVGIKGDSRSYGYTVTLKAVKSEDGMTASWARLPWDLLDKASKEITNLLPDISMVSYAISDKPPSTIEPQ